MAPIPTEGDILERARELGLVDANAEGVPHDVRRQVARMLQDERSAPPAPAPALPDVTLLSRATHQVAGGTIRVDVLFIPDPDTKGPTT